MGNLLDSSAFHRSWEMAPRFLCSWSIYPIMSIPVSCCFVRGAQPSTGSTTVIPSPASRWSGQSSRALRRAVLAVTWVPREAAPGKGWKLFPELLSAPPSPPHPHSILIAAAGQEPCYTSPHLSIYSETLLPRSCLCSGPAPAPGALVPSSAGRIAFRFIHDQVLVPFLTNCSFLGVQPHIPCSATQVFSRKTEQDLAPSTSALFLCLLTPPSSLHRVAR